MIGIYAHGPRPIRSEPVEDLVDILRGLFVFIAAEAVALADCFLLTVIAAVGKLASSVINSYLSK
jgi:hypothetical protein